MVRFLAKGHSYAVLLLGEEKFALQYEIFDVSENFCN